MGKPSKDPPWLEIFNKYDIHSHNFELGPFFIDAQQIKSACAHFTKTAEKEVRILCYQAQRNDKPEIFVKNNLFLLPVKNGKYAIIRGEGYIDIPQIETAPVRFNPALDFELESSNIGNSEMQHLDYAYACGMIEDFVNVGKLGKKHHHWSNQKNRYFLKELETNGHAEYTTKLFHTHENIKKLYEGLPHAVEFDGKLTKPIGRMSQKIPILQDKFAS